MYKLSIIVFVIAAICSCYGISNRRLIRSTSEISTEANPIIITDVNTPQDSAAAETSDITDIFTARGKQHNKGGKHKMEVMHMGLSYIKMVISTLMSVVGHVLAFKAVALTLISVLIQIAQFVMMLKRDKEQHHSPPAYIHSKIIESPYHHSPQQPEPYGGSGKVPNVDYAAPYNVRRRR